jgi:hypothetical protein
MNTFISRTRAPVRRRNAQNYLLIMLMGFALSIILTRLFLTLTGFPKIGGGGFHIAHVLWGGLLLFISGLLLLILENRWAYPLGAVLSGIGVGLFIDEVGKFVTQNNDYFSPLAAPIIYAFFLIAVLIYLRVKRSPSQDPRAELYHALDLLEEMLDHDLEAHERADLVAQLNRISQQEKQSDLARLAQVLHDFLSSDTLYLAPDAPNPWERLLKWVRAQEKHWIGRRRLKFALVSGLGVFGFVAVLEPVLMFVAALLPGSLEEIAADLFAGGQVGSVVSFQWYFVRLALDGIVGLILLVASVDLLTGRDRRGCDLGYFGLLFSLTTVNLLTFYFAQFGNIVLALVQFVLLLGVIYYRRWYVLRQTPAKNG